jgi:hypothetical protein
MEDRLMRFIWGMLLVFTFGCASGPATFLPSGDPVVDMFEAVVFTEVIDRSNPRVVSKWVEPLKIKLEGEDAEAFSSTVAHHARTLSELTGLRFEIAAVGETANVVIVFGNIEQLEDEIAPFLEDPDFMIPMMLSAGCLFVYSEDQQNQIYEAKIFVRTGRSAGGTSACLLGDMTQVLGLSHDAGFVRPSVFNGDDVLTALTPTDESLVRALYNSAIHPGMARQPAMTVAKDLLSAEN